MNETFPFTFRERLTDFAWVKSEQEKLQKHIQELTTEKMTWESFLATVNGSGMFNIIGEA